MPFEIRLATTTEEAHDVFRFRYLVHTLDSSRPQYYADHVRQMIRDPLDDFAQHLVAYERGEMVGVIRSNLCRDGDFGQLEPRYGLADLEPGERETYSVTSRLMVAQQPPKSRLLIELAKATYFHNLANGVRHDLIDCKQPLPRFLRRLGYRTIRKAACDQEAGFVEVMRLCMLDAASLERIRSPLLPLLAESRRETCRKRLADKQPCLETEKECCRQ